MTTRKAMNLPLCEIPDGCGFSFQKYPSLTETAENLSLESHLRMGSFSYLGLLEEMNQKNKSMKLKSVPEKLTKSQKSRMKALGKKLHQPIQEQHTLDMLHRRNIEMDSNGRRLEVYALTQCEVEDCGDISSRTRERMAKLHSLVGRKVVGVMVDKESTLRSGTLYKLHLLFD